MPSLRPLVLPALVASLAACGPRVEPTWDNVASAACSDCAHERVDLSRPDRIVINRVVAVDVSSRSRARRVSDRQWIQMRAGQGISRIVSARFLGADGRMVQVDEPALETWSACQQARWDNTRPPDGRSPDCARLPLRIPGKGVLVVQFQQDVRTLFPGGHRARFIPRIHPSSMGFSIVGADPGSLHKRGEFVVDPATGTLVYAGGWASDVGVSTVDGWAPIGRAYAAIEAEAMGPFEAPAPGDAPAPEQALRDASAWIAANLRYSGDRMGFEEAVRPNTFAETVASGEGDCKEFALVLRRLLAERGVESESVFVKLDSTEVPDRALPAPADYDHVVVYIPALGRYVDPTRGRVDHMLADASDRFAYAIHTSDGRLVRTR